MRRDVINTHSAATAGMTTHDVAQRAQLPMPHAL
jgi:hypothetical protein